MRISEPLFTYTTTGRQAVESKLQIIHGEDITVIKGKSCLQSTAESLVGHTLSPNQVDAVMGNVIYPDWGGQSNQISEPMELIGYDANRASCYLVFK
ncbi:MAG: hypothetical protein H8E85_02475 [Candidatus Marinimicrobia bacterium]|nr:hypothetical protein [Candidatus Neomarinimicrobiota bacterium]